ncbi:MAG: hypothetical protein RL745_640, partial [Actinomycetota bacterium]
MPAKSPKVAPGLVAFVSAGPGDLELLSVRAVDLLRSAQVVIADADAAAVVNAYVSQAAQVSFAVDEAGAALTPAARARLVADASKSGVRVVRLLAGDAALDASVVSEVAAIHKAGLPFEIAPAASTVFATPAYAGFTLAG